MPLHPQARAYLDLVSPPGMPELHQLPMTVPEIRALVLSMFSARHAGTPIPMARVENRTIPGPAGAVPVRVYRPTDDAAPLPALMYFHGGGWVILGLDSHDAPCRALARDARCVVVSVDYRLAPEHKFPAAPEDCYAATRYVAEHAAEFGADPTRIAVGGDSAGGNLAAVVCLMARDRGGPRLAHQLLIYPATDAANQWPSVRDNATGYMLTKATMDWFWNHYRASEADAHDPYASPLCAARHDALPGATILTAEFDPLRDEGEAYGERLRAAGSTVSITRYAGMIHGFYGLFAFFDDAYRASDEAAAALRAAFA